MKEIPLTKGKVALVDDADYDWLMQWKWHTVGDYAVRRTRLDPPVGGKRQGVQFMHRLIMGEPHGVKVDHHSRNSLDNRRSNLRVATTSQNMMNAGKLRASRAKSQYKGVCYGKCGWQAQIMYQGKSRWLGYHTTEIAAAYAYDNTARDLFGEFACLNFPEEQPCSQGQ